MTAIEVLLPPYITVEFPVLLEVVLAKNLLQAEGFYLYVKKNTIILLHLLAKISNAMPLSELGQRSAKENAQAAAQTSSPCRTEDFTVSGRGV